MTLLATRALCKSFGGLAAVSDVDFALDPGEIRAVIGPNGAGKTTLVGMICGRLRPTSGTIVFDGEDVTRLGAPERVHRGIVYTFQITSIFKNLSCFDHVALAAQRAMTWRGAAWRPLDGAAVALEAAGALDRLGLGACREATASTLPYGHQRLLEIAMGLALRPRLLILDEPTQGLGEEERADFCRLARDIAKEATVLLIEHNMSVVMELADRITVMNNGGILAEGRPGDIARDPRVRAAYLGT